MPIQEKEQEGTGKRKREGELEDVVEKNDFVKLSGISL